MYFFATVTVHQFFCIIHLFYNIHFDIKDDKHDALFSSITLHITRTTRNLLFDCYDYIYVLYFYVPDRMMGEGILFLSSLFVCLSVCCQL